MPLTYIQMEIYISLNPCVHPVAESLEKGSMRHIAQYHGGYRRITVAEDEDGAMAEAVAAVKSNNVAFCFTGSNMDWEAEGEDRSQFMLPGRTNDLIEKILDVEPETVICNLSGSAFGMPWVARASTVMQSWFGGNETGERGRGSIWLRESKLIACGIMTSR
jgi:hypothetical protein